VEVGRGEKPPLVLRADRGTMAGEAGRRHLVLEGGVEIVDEDAGLRFALPAAEVDEAAGEARSLGALTFAGGRYHGNAARVVHPLDGDRDSVLESLVMEDDEGLRARADRAFGRPGGHEFELDGSVRVERGGTTVEADRIRLARGDDQRLRRAIAEGGVTCREFPIAGGLTGLRASRLEIDWDDAGAPRAALATGQAEITRNRDVLRAETIEATREAPPVWRVIARGSVRGAGVGGAAPAEIESDVLSVTLGGDGPPSFAEASGAVRFRAREARGEAARATWDASDPEGPITLFAAPGRPARLARDRTRVSAQQIRTDAKGAHLRAAGGVEATLLDARADRRGLRPGVFFEAGQAVHFVAARLDGVAQGSHLVFEGSVRGWQGERNLAADRVELDQGSESLVATGNVVTRFPREAAGGAPSVEYVEVSAGALRYAGKGGGAVYDGGTRVRQAEGWIEADRLEVDLDEAGRKVREIRALGAVRFEMRPDAAVAERGPVHGAGDRAVYLPVERILRLFGDVAPASVTHGGERGGTTTGRVLRYRLDEGTLEVESTDADASGGAARGR
jgi:lipopolysaccharide transport protein LptA